VVVVVVVVVVLGVLVLGCWGWVGRELGGGLVCVVSAYALL
jgi:hypothetical protein